MPGITLRVGWSIWREILRQTERRVIVIFQPKLWQLLHLQQLRPSRSRTATGSGRKLWALRSLF